MMQRKLQDPNQRQHLMGLKRPNTLALMKQNGDTTRKIAMDNEPPKHPQHEVRSENPVFLEIKIADKNFDQDSKSYVYMSGFQESLQREQISDNQLQGIAQKNYRSAIFENDSNHEDYFRKLKDALRV